METNDPSLLDALNLLRSGLRWALPIALLLAAAVYFLQSQQTPIYQATSQLLLIQGNNGGDNLSSVPVTPISSAAYETALKSPDVMSATREALEAEGTFNAEQFSTVDIDGDTAEDPVSSILSIEASSPDPELTAAAANAAASALIDWDTQRLAQRVSGEVQRLEQQISNLAAEIQRLTVIETESSRAQIDTLSRLRGDLQTRLSLANSSLGATSGLITFLEPAIIPNQPSEPRPARTAALVFILTLIMVYGILLLRNALDTRIKTREDLTRLSGFPVLADLPDLRRSPNVFREAVSYIHTNLAFSLPESSSQVILVTSRDGEEDKMGLAFQLAKSFARSQSDVLLIDADLRSPTIAKDLKFSVKGYPGLPDYLSNPELKFHPASVVFEKHELGFIPTFSPAATPHELLRMGFARFLEQCKSEYSVIIVDAPPMLAVADSLAIAPYCNALACVINVKKTKRNEVQELSELLRRSNVPVAGFVVTDAESSQISLYGDISAPKRTRNRGDDILTGLRPSQAKRVERSE